MQYGNLPQLPTGVNSTEFNIGGESQIPKVAPKSAHASEKLDGELTFGRRVRNIPPNIGKVSDGPNFVPRSYLLGTPW